MTGNGYQEVWHWIDLAIDSMVILINRLNTYDGEMLMEKYNWYLLDVKDRETTEEDVVVQKEVNKVVGECREQGLLTRQHCKADRPHYLKWAKFLGNFLGWTNLGRQSM